MILVLLLGGNGGSCVVGVVAYYNLTNNATTQTACNLNRVATPPKLL